MDLLYQDAMQWHLLNWNKVLGQKLLERNKDV